ncbi:uncharacterized protein RIMBP3C isoform X2 [Gallus gallus]|uniref:uncharacterized protein RIMBP3C isoform X1 n=1 Tax=Gallus gallus TaxID=9031 RepID=UPI001EFF82B8|nr:uncharacterized protein RIMBP3C isoform X1 [Gallus gallus]XP_046759782.1 uncharacterized protein LOC107057437 isoform X1 [Gallus gallus]XP_046788413.1 uncharacterized protein RIMBP3C isoform X2 [Gallus gallus]
MVQVWGAVAPARLVLLLVLLLAMCFRETCTAPRRAPGADDELGAPFLESPDFMPVPEGQPGGPAGESADRNPVHEPEGDAGDVTGGGNPASLLSSGTETPVDRVEVPPGRALHARWFLPVLEPRKDESRRGKYSRGSSRLLKELLKGMEMAAHGTDRRTAQKEALQECSHPRLPASDKGTQAAPTTGMPSNFCPRNFSSGMNAGKNTKAAVCRSVQKRHIAVLVLLSAVPLSTLVLVCVAVSCTWKKCLVCKREERAGERAHPDTNWERVPTGDEGRVELGEATKEILAQANKNLSNSSSPFHSAIQEAKDLQTDLEDLERERKAMKEVHGNSCECCFLSEDGPESESGGSAVERLSFTLPSPGQVSPMLRRFLARRSYDPFEGPNEDPESELPLTAGQYVYVFGDVDENGWFLGELTDGTRGLVPSNLVAEVSDDDLDTTLPPKLRDLLLDTDG